MRLSEVLVSRDLMTHEVRLTDVADRKALFADMARKRSVLHVGCCDVPVFDPDANLHVFLSRFTTRLDGLDVSEPGIAVLRKHVGGDYFTAPERVSKEYELVLVPEVLEHTRDPGDFLRGIFSIQARTYVFTAPSFEWFREARRSGDVFFERVHGDHKAWYSPYTLLATLRPFIDEEADDVEVYSIAQLGSVGVRVSKPRELRPWEDAPPSSSPALGDVSAKASALCERGEIGAAMELLRLGYESLGDLRLAYEEIALRLGVGQNLEALRRSVEVMKEHPEQSQLLYFAAEASERLGDAAQAEELRQMARLRG